MTLSRSPSYSLLSDEPVCDSAGLVSMVSGCERPAVICHLVSVIYMEQLCGVPVTCRNPPFSFLPSALVVSPQIHKTGRIGRTGQEQDERCVGGWGRVLGTRTPEAQPIPLLSSLTHRFRLSAFWLRLAFLDWNSGKLKLIVPL